MNSRKASIHAGQLLAVDLEEVDAEKVDETLLSKSSYR
jgi:hypothetical protein